MSKRIINKILAGIVCLSIVLGASGQVCEAKTIMSQEMLNDLINYIDFIDGDDGIFYDCGNSTEDGVIRIESKSNSLQEGDEVEIELFLNAENNPVDEGNNPLGRLYAINFEIGYDKNVLGDMAIEIPREIDYETLIKGDNYIEILFGIDNMSYYRNACVAKIKFTVKNAVPSTKIYSSFFILTGCRTGVKNYFDETSSNRQDWWSDVLTLNIEDTKNQSSTGNSFALSATPKEAPAGSDITVPLNITSNPGINALGITVTYDQSMCDYKDLVIADKFKNLISLDSIYKVPGEGKVKLSFIAKDNITDIGTFANLSLKLKDGVADGTSSKVSVAIEQVTNKELTTVTGTGASAKITVKEEPKLVYTLGDVNEDGRIDLTDAIYILLNYNEEKVLTDAQKKAADINKDNAVDLMDALQILKYFNGEIKAL